MVVNYRPTNTMNLDIIERDSLPQMTPEFLRHKQPVTGLMCVDEFEVEDTLDMLNAPIGRRLIDADYLGGFSTPDQD